MPLMTDAVFGYRIHRGDWVTLSILPLVVANVGGRVYVEYDDGHTDRLEFVETTTVAGTSVTVPTQFVSKMDGRVTQLKIYGNPAGTLPPGSVYCEVAIAGGSASSPGYQLIARGYLEEFTAPTLGVFDPQDEWATWVYQATIGEDGTAGTHICTLTVTPGAGNAMEVSYGSLLVGATATTQTLNVFIDDGTNVLAYFVRNVGVTTSGLTFSFPSASAVAAAATTGWLIAGQKFIVSGTMRLVLSISTAAVSVTQTFAVACKIRGGLPTATLLDTIGTSTNTVNTSAVL